MDSAAFSGIQGQPHAVRRGVSVWLRGWFERLRGFSFWVWGLGLGRPVNAKRLAMCFMGITLG